MPTKGQPVTIGGGSWALGITACLIAFAICIFILVVLV